MNKKAEAAGRLSPAGKHCMYESDEEHQFYIYRTHEEGRIAWDLEDSSERRAPAYFRQVLQTASERLGGHGLTFYITWELDRIPSYGDDVVTIVMGDEWCRVPAYADDVLVSFKCYGTQYTAGWAPFHQPIHLSTLIALKYLQVTWERLRGPGEGTALRHALRWWNASSPIYSVPLGYGNQLDLPITPIAERDHDIFFAGSVKHHAYSRSTIKDRLRSPKDVARERMLHYLDRLQQSRPDLSVDLATTFEFALNAIQYEKDSSKDMLDAEAYSKRMMNSKICLVPRGTSLETYRFFEALRYGCIPITEPLPSRWFYDEAPHVPLRDWSALGPAVDRLISDPSQLQRKHDEALRWWDRVCSPQTVGTFIADKIAPLRRSKV